MIKKIDISHFDLLDWNFNKEDSRLFLHNFCWYPSRFIPIIPSHLIQALSKPHDTVLDPFCGSGTTLIEAYKLNRNAIGVDLHPVACFITKTKGRILRGERVAINKIVEIRDYFMPLSYDLFRNQREAKYSLERLKKIIPNFELNKEWYHPDTLEMLGNIYYHIEELKSGLAKDICKIFFISVLMPSSGCDSNKPYTYYADNVKPKEKIFKNAYKLFVMKVDKFIFEYKNNNDKDDKSKFEVYNADTRNLEKLVHNKVDLIVTSPPYLNVTDYIAGFRLIYLWYDFLGNYSLNDLKQREIGARSRRKKISSPVEYQYDMELTLERMVRVLKKNGYMCLVLGEPKKYYASIKQHLSHFLTNKLNLEFIDSFARKISKNFFIHPTGGVRTEEILIFRK